MLVVRLIFAVQLGSCKFTDTDDTRSLGHWTSVGSVSGPRGRPEGDGFVALVLALSPAQKLEASRKMACFVFRLHCGNLRGSVCVFQFSFYGSNPHPSRCTLHLPSPSFTWAPQVLRTAAPSPQSAARRSPIRRASRPRWSGPRPRRAPSCRQTARRWPRRG